MIESIPVFAHGGAGMGMVYLIILIGGSLALGTITVLVTAAITKKWSWGKLGRWRSLQSCAAHTAGILLRCAKQIVFCARKLRFSRPSR
jgi:hypothetical protein